MSKYNFTLNEDAKNYCKEILHETEESRKKSFKALRQWAEENPHLNINTEDTALIPFLRGCKFNLDKTKIKLENYYKLRRDCPEWFENRNPLLPEIQDLSKIGVFIPLKKRYENKMIVVIRTAVHNPRVHKQDDVFKTGMMILDLACKECEEAQIYGVIAIFDMKGVGLSHARQLTPSMIKRAVHAWQNYHVRPKKLDFINAPTYINVVLNIFKQFMSEKLRDRVKCYFKLESLYKDIPKEYLPKEFGGTEGELNEYIDYWHERLINNAEWFKEDEKFRAS